MRMWWCTGGLGVDDPLLEAIGKPLGGLAICREVLLAVGKLGEKVGLCGGMKLGCCC